jgi:hypothetical protein
MSDSHASATPSGHPEIPGAVPPTGPATDPAADPATVPHAGARYAVLRLALLATVGGLLYLVGMRGWALLFVAVLASGVLSFFVFLRQREAAARSLEARLHAARNHGPADDRSDEQGPDGAPVADRQEEPADESRATIDADPPPTAP